METRMKRRTEAPASPLRLRGATPNAFQAAFDGRATKNGAHHPKYRIVRAVIAITRTGS